MARAIFVPLIGRTYEVTVHGSEKGLAFNNLPSPRLTPRICSETDNVLERSERRPRRHPLVSIQSNLPPLRLSLKRGSADRFQNRDGETLPVA